MDQDIRYAQNRELHIEVYHSCNKLHAAHEMRELHIKVYHSCNKLHATREMVNYRFRLIIRALAGYNSKVR